MMDKPSDSKHPDPTVRQRFDEALSIMNDDRETAILLLRMNSSMGCTDSMVLLGDILTDGDEKERKESIDLFELASGTNSSGMRNLAYCYAIGLNVERDKEKGARLYIEAAEMGNPRAMCNIGVMYDHGNGVEQDFEKAFQWYLRSAEEGYPRGMTNLGEHYLWGKGTEKDLAEAERWLSAAGTPRSSYRLYEVYKETGDDRAMDALLKAVDGRYSRALYTYGRMIEPDRPDDAIEMYKDAASKGNTDSIERLKELGAEVPERRFKKRKKS